MTDVRATTDALLRCGATIREINAVRKHLSALKGGRLAALAAPATTATLVLSDVVGNHLDVIASGPFVPDPTTFADAKEIVDRYDLSLPAAVEERIDVGVDGEIEEQMVRFRDLGTRSEEAELVDDVSYEPWMGSRHMSAIETSVRPEVVATVTLSEETGRVSVFRDGDAESRERDELGGAWRVE